MDPETGNYTFTAPAGKKFTKIEINGNDSPQWQDNNPMTSNGWAITGGFGSNYKATWTGSAKTVTLFNGDNKFDFYPELYSLCLIAFSTYTEGTVPFVYTGPAPCAINTEPPPAEMQRGGFFARGLKVRLCTRTDFCAISLAVLDIIRIFAPVKRYD